MTYTEESLMALAKECAHKLANEANWHGLRLAIREGLAERDGLRKRLEASCDDARSDPEATECPIGYRLNRAEAEVERLRKGGCARNQGLTQYCAEAEALRKDAERYQWLRDHTWSAELSRIINLQQNAKWDAAIDAAIKESK